ncbi:MAG: nucleotidyltransferase family protein [Pseudomonadales bacterium]
MKAMILAAGLGTRMRPLTDHCPKPLLDVAGKPLIVRHIERLAAAGFRELVINIAHLGCMIEEALGDGSTWGVQIAYSRESQPLETAGGIVKALPLLGDAPFLVINGDIWTDFPLNTLPNHFANGALAHLVLVNNPEHHPQGDFVLQDGKVQPRGEEQGLTFSGVSVLSPDLFSAWRERAGSAFPLREVLLPAMQQAAVSGEHYQGYWLDVGTPQRLQQLTQKLA